MPQKSSTRNLSSSTKTQFHQIGNLRGQQSNLPISNQRVLILSTPIKLKDGTVNMEQRAIPLRIDNSQLIVTTKENNSRVISLKQNKKLSPPSALALPINKLNKKSPTVVKNEVGQVMGKLIPLGKFSNIAPSSTLPPISTVPTSPAVPVTNVKNLKQKCSKHNSKWGGYKLLKLHKDVIEASKIASEKFKEVMKSKQQSSDKLHASTEVNNAITISQPVLEHVENTDEQLITVTDVKPKKQVHLVLKGFKHMASIGHTGTNIKLIPLEHWNTDTKLNLAKTQTDTSAISQQKMVDLRSCAIDRINNRDKLNCDYDKEDFDIDIMLEKDPLDIDGISNEESASFTQSLDRSALNNGTHSNVDLDLVERFQITDGTDSSCGTTEFRGLNSSDAASLTHSNETCGLKLICESQIESDCLENNNVLSKNEISDSKCNETVVGNVEVDPVTGSMAENDQGDREIENNDINCIDLYKRFQISKDDITFRETEMLSYICDLKKKLLQNQKTRVRGSGTVEKKEYLGSNNLSSIQKRFIKLQLRNSGRGSKEQRFTKTDMAMARDVFQVTGPKGYNNLRKLFCLPGIGTVVRAMSKT